MMSSLQVLTKPNAASVSKCRGGPPCCLLWHSLGQMAMEEVSCQPAWKTYWAAQKQHAQFDEICCSLHCPAAHHCHALPEQLRCFWQGVVKSRPGKHL